MSRDKIMKRYNCDYSDACTIEKIVTVDNFNKNCHPDNKVSYTSGYVMPMYHGYMWAKTKIELVRNFTFAKI